jgi:branched-chain amino acid transport system permease protein
MIERILIAIVLSLPLAGAYGIFAVGIVLMYRASRVLNLAHGAMAMLPAYLVFAMSRAGVPVVLALPLGLLFGAALGVVVELVFVRRLRGDSLTAQTVGTVAALGILVAIAARVWGTFSRTAPHFFPEGRISIGLSSIRYGEIGLFVVMLAVTGVLYVVIQRTDLGLMMRGTAEDRRAAALMGVDADRITSLTWALGGMLAALGGLLLAGVTSLHPYTLSLQVLPAFIAALVGGLGSLPGAVVGAGVVAVVQALVPVFHQLDHTEGAPQLFLALLAIAVMARRGTRYAAGGSEAGL